MDTEPFVAVFNHTLPLLPRCVPGSGTRSRIPSQMTMSPGAAMRGSRLARVCPSSSRNVRTLGVGEVRPGVDTVSGPLEAGGPDELVHAPSARPTATDPQHEAHRGTSAVRLARRDAGRRRSELTEWFESLEAPSLHTLRTRM
jgi:hypothetical protein